MSPFESVDDGEERAVAVGSVRWWTVRRLKGDVGLLDQVVVERRVDGREGREMAP